MATVLNQDVVGLHARINRFITELYHSVGSSVSQMTTADQARAMSYLDALDTYHRWITEQEELDLPESHPKEYELEADPTIESIENESVNDLIRQFESMRIELVNSQSARRPAGLISFDSGRFTALVAKSRSFLVNYVAVATPLDLPESSPQEKTSGKGKLGV